MAKADSAVICDAELYPARGYNCHESRNNGLNEKSSHHDISGEESGKIQHSISDDSDFEGKPNESLVCRFSLCDNLYSNADITTGNLGWTT